MKLRVALALLAMSTWAGVAVAQDEMPPGHPPVGVAPGANGQEEEQEDELPSGHPQVGSGDGAGDPHAHGAPDPMQDVRDRIYRPPPDGAGDDPKLPAGTIVASIRDAQDRPIPHAPVTLGILHASVAKGEARESVAKETDDKGEVRFDKLGTGSGVTYHVTTSRGSASFAAQPFALGARAGKRAVVHSFEVSQDVEHMPVLVEAVVYVALREDAIVVEQLVTVMNLGPVAWYADATFALPPGFKAFNKQDSTTDARVEEVANQGAALRGTFPPGQQQLDFRYQIPLDDTSTQRFKIETPPHTWKSRVIAEATKAMTLSVEGFPDAQRQTRDGKRLLVTERVAQREEGGQRQIDVALNGLPTPGPGRWIALGLGLLALVLGATTLFGGQRSDMDPEVRKDLVDAREKLLDELVTLERMHKSGEVGPMTYARVRSSLLDALARVVEQLDRKVTKEPLKGRPRSGAARGTA